MTTPMAEPIVKLGNRIGPLVRRVDPDWARAYALATNDPNPAYLEGDAVPPVFTVSMILPLFLDAMVDCTPPGAITGATGGVHGQHDLYLHEPVRPGVTLRAVAEGWAAGMTPAGARVSIRIQLFDDERDVLCVEHFWTTLHIKGQVEPAGPAFPEHDFPDAARDRPLGTLTVPLTADQTYRYAGASFDHAWIHMDDVAAQEIGMPRKIMQGLSTFAMCSQAVVQHGAGGDPTRLRRLAARFTAPAFPGEDLVVNTFDAGTTASGRTAVAFEAHCLGRTSIRHGWAELDG
jgi:acyl dehydratase